MTMLVTEDDRATAPEADPILHEMTGEFRDPVVEREYRRAEMERNGRRMARSAWYIAAVLLLFTFSDLAALGVGSTWLLLLALRSVAAAAVATIARGARRDPQRYVEGAGARSLLVVQIVVLVAFLVISAVRPENAVTLAVSTILIALVIGFFVPVPMRTKTALILAFQACFVVVAATRFDTTGVATGPLAANLAAVSLFAFTVVSNLNRAQRMEWWVNREQRDANDRLVAEVARGEQLCADLQRQATQDPLTGLANRRSFFARGDELVEFSRRHGRPVTAVLMDADGFKQVNDRHGHAAGDAVLKAVGETLRSCSRRGEVVGRIGGEEFAVIAEGLDDVAAAALAERMRAAVRSSTVVVDGRPIGVTASVGFTRVGAAESLAAALGRADRAMYRAKRSGGDRVLSSTA